MIVAAIVVCVLAGLLCWVVLRLDSNAKLRSVLVDARIWKAINIKFQIERDTGTPDPPTENPPTIAVIDEPDQSYSFTPGTSPSAANQAAVRTAGPRREQPTTRRPKPHDNVAGAPDHPHRRRPRSR